MTELSKPAGDRPAPPPVSAPPSPPLTGDAYVGMQADPAFQDLRRRFRRFVFPMTALFLVWYLLYVLLADYAHDFMATEVVGNINVGLVFGLLQFVSTFVITALYVRFADRHVDPAAERLRERMAHPDASTQGERR